MKQKNPTAFGKVLQKIKVLKTYQEPDGLDYWNALFDLEIAEPVDFGSGPLPGESSDIRWVD